MNSCNILNNGEQNCNIDGKRKVERNMPDNFFFKRLKYRFCSCNLLCNYKLIQYSISINRYTFNRISYYRTSEPEWFAQNRYRTPINFKWKVGEDREIKFHILPSQLLA